MDHIRAMGLRIRSSAVNPATAVSQREGRRRMAAIPRTSVQSSESKPHCPHRSTVTLLILHHGHAEFSAERSGRPRWSEPVGPQEAHELVVGGPLVPEVPVGT